MSNKLPDDRTKYIGKHTGGCPKCGFSLMSDTDKVCPRCGKKVNKETK